MNIVKISTLAAEECVRQQVGLDRVAMLIGAYEIVCRTGLKSTTPTLTSMLSIARVIEPLNYGGLRTTPVTFQNGGSSASPSLVAQASLRLFDSLPTEDIDDWITQFLWIHPLIDGNGRTAWVLWNWLNGTLDEPKTLPDFFSASSERR